MMANTFRIYEVDFQDTDNFLYSETLVDFAIAKGFYNLATGEYFCFAEVYGNLVKLRPTSNRLRHWRVESLLDNATPRIKTTDIMDILKDHYEETEYNFKNGYDISPHHTDVRTICTLLYEDATGMSFIAQLRDWL